MHSGFGHTERSGRGCLLDASTVPDEEREDKMAAAVVAGVVLYLTGGLPFDSGFSFRFFVGLIFTDLDKADRVLPDVNSAVIDIELRLLDNGKAEVLFSVITD
jgi:hypothetical protein